MIADAIQRRQTVTRGMRLEYVTVGWNVFEGIVAVLSGLLAGSVALIGFGVDSAIESGSGAVLLWRLRAEQTGKNVESAEERALKLVGVSLLLLAAYVTFDAIKTLVTREQPQRSFIGIGLSVLSLIVMPVLARAKRRTASELNSAAMHADSRQTSICAYLSAILLGGLVLNAVAEWWWADPIAALAMVPIIVREGREALKGEPCPACN
ncbi:MAG: integral rane protein [Acidobacteriaceae bacterium]|jgi:divalent metal cation (Fe/Co/Zn/Cd) transporter|nr:integral rane protein [Acidobacteriaceae bacterium]